MACPLKWDVYKEWLKPEDIKLTMPLWTWPEIETLWQLYYKGECPELVLERDFPRMVLERPANLKRALPSRMGQQIQMQS